MTARPLRAISAASSFAKVVFPDAVRPSIATRTGLENLKLEIISASRPSNAGLRDCDVIMSRRILSHRHRQTGAIRAHDPHPAAGGRVGPGDAPDGVVDPPGAGAIDDRLLQREDAADHRLRTLVEERIAVADAG